MFLLRPSERKGDARGCADAAAEWPNYRPALHFCPSRPLSEGRVMMTPVSSQGCFLLQPAYKAAWAIGSVCLPSMCTFTAAFSLFICSHWRYVISQSEVLKIDPGIKLLVSSLQMILPSLFFVHFP